MPLVSCAPGGPPLASPPRATAHEEDLSGRFFDEVNRYRARHGKRVLPRHAGLDKLARRHAGYLRAHSGKFSLHASSVSHHGFKSRAHYAQEVYGIPSVAENVAAGRSGVRGLVNSLAESPNHKHAMLNDWSVSGCAVVVGGDGTLTAVQLFGADPVSRARLMRESLPGY